MGYDCVTDAFTADEVRLKAPPTRIPGAERAQLPGFASLDVCLLTSKGQR